MGAAFGPRFSSSPRLSTPDSHLQPAERARIAIIADDLTGASDAGVQFARRGLRTLVLFDAEDLGIDVELVHVIAIDTDSRALSPVAAAARITPVVAALRAAGFAHVYKKVDSTLRGNLGAEIDATLDAGCFDVAVVAPGFPALGRTTHQGVHLVHGIPVHETEAARDPRSPVHESDVVRLLSSQSRRRVALVPLAVLQQGPHAIRREAHRLVARGVSLLVFDADADATLRLIATAMAASTYRTLWVGSAGLAEHLPDVLGLPVCDPPRPRFEPSDKPVLVVAGSASVTTREQVAALRLVPGMVAIELDPRRLGLNAVASSAEAERCRAAVAQALLCGRDVVLHVQGPATDPGGPANVSAHIVSVLSAVAADVLPTQEVQGVALTGGETAKAVCRRLGVTGMQLLAEIEPGVPLGRLVGGSDLLAVTKAGAFGTANTLVHAHRRLKLGT